MKHGDRFSAIIHGVEVEGKISISRSIIYGGGHNVYLCQNDFNGDSCEHKLGYRYSWSIGRLSKFTTNNCRYLTDIEKDQILFDNIKNVKNLKIFSDRKSRIESLEL